MRSKNAISHSFKGILIFEAMVLKPKFSYIFPLLFNNTLICEIIVLKPLIGHTFSHLFKVIYILESMVLKSLFSYSCFIRYLYSKQWF